MTDKTDTMRHSDSLNRHCGHGVSYDAPCVECSLLNFREVLEWIEGDLQRAKRSAFDAGHQDVHVCLAEAEALVRSARLALPKDRAPLQPKPDR